MRPARSMENVLRLYPGPPQELAAEDVYADLTFPGSGSPGDEPYVAINMVSTLDGKVSMGGKASPIGGPVDRVVMRNIRCAVDAVLVGAGTARAEEMNLGVPEALSEKRKANGLPAQPLGVILAGAGELPLTRKLFRSRVQPPIVIAGEATPETTLREASRLGVRVLRVRGSYLPDPREVLRLLNERLNARAVLLEGGPTVNGAFLSSGKVDELFLTLSPKISRSGADASTLATTDEGAEPNATGFELASVYSSPQAGELYLRYLNRDR